MEPFIQNQWLWMIVLVPMSLIFSFYLYGKTKLPYKWLKPLLIGLRATSLTLIFILLLNPQIRQKSVALVYPELSILLDQSQSIKDSIALVAFYEQWKNDRALNDKFQVNWYGFGLDLQPIEQLDFLKTESNIGGAVRNLDRILGQNQGPIIILTDGQQTIGPEYSYYKAQNRPIYPVIVGDTIWPEDISIQRVTANPVVRKGQPFEVELLINRTGSSQKIDTQLEVYQDGIKVQTTDLKLPNGATRQLIQTELITELVGNQTFKWVLKSIPGEQIVANNTAVLNIEAIDEQRRLLLVYDEIHPDIGALTRGLLADDYTEVISVSPERAAAYLDQIDAVVLYQPTKNFSDLMDQLSKKPVNTWLITGPQTQWSEITKIQPAIQKDFLGISDALFPRPNLGFSLFKSPWDQWENLPPLVTDIGALVIEGPHQVLLSPELQNQPLSSVQLGFFEDKGVRWIIWDGIDLWRWKIEAFRITKSHEEFDAFLGVLAKYIGKHQEKSRLKLNYKAVYNQLAQAEFYVQYLDKTDALDLTADLEIRMVNQQTKQVITRPLLADEKQYKLGLADLPEGVYDFTVRVLGSDDQKSGRFDIAPLDSELGQGFAKVQPMRDWAALNQVPLQDLSQMNEFREFLKSQKEFLPREVVTFKNLDFIRWYYALALLILISSLEWFIRKYNGLI